jgi:predicted ATP-grasp superfamily ATP-dependent carboligase
MKWLMNQSNRQEGALVIAEHYRGLALVRSLGRRGIPVWTLEPEFEFMASASRYCRKSLRWPAGEDREQLDYLFALAERHQLDGWTLFATSDEPTMWVGRHHAALSSRFRMTVPPWDVLRWAYDKRLTYRLAADIGVDCPATFYPKTRDELLKLDLSFPVILKPAFKKQENRFTREKAWRADDRETLAARYLEASELVGPDAVMVQELVSGGGEAQFSYAALCAEGRTLASVTARRTRQYPVEFGRSSSFVETCDQPALEEPARNLLAAMRYTGLAEVEFKFDQKDGRYKLLDVNPRAWTWQQLCPAAGVDFPYLLWRSIRGEHVPKIRGRAGIRWVRLSTDVAAASTEIMQGRLSVRAYLQSLKGPLEFAALAPDDPLPALLRVPARAYSLGKRFIRPGLLWLRSRISGSQPSQRLETKRGLEGDVKPSDASARSGKTCSRSIQAVR